MIFDRLAGNKNNDNDDDQKQETEQKTTCKDLVKQRKEEARNKELIDAVDYIISQAEPDKTEETAEMDEKQDYIYKTRTNTYRFKPADLEIKEVLHWYSDHKEKHLDRYVVRTGEDREEVLKGRPKSNTKNIIRAYKPGGWEEELKTAEAYLRKEAERKRREAEKERLQENWGIEPGEDCVIE